MNRIINRAMRWISNIESTPLTTGLIFFLFALFSFLLIYFTDPMWWALESDDAWGAVGVGVLISIIFGAIAGLFHAADARS